MPCPSLTVHEGFGLRGVYSRSITRTRKITAKEQEQIVHDLALYMEIDSPAGGVEMRHVGWSQTST